MQLLEAVHILWPVFYIIASAKIIHPVGFAKHDLFKCWGHATLQPCVMHMRRQHIAPSLASAAVHVGELLRCNSCSVVIALIQCWICLGQTPNWHDLTIFFSRDFFMLVALATSLKQQWICTCLCRSQWPKHLWKHCAGLWSFSRYCLNWYEIPGQQWVA